MSPVKIVHSCIPGRGVGNESETSGFMSGQRENYALKPKCKENRSKTNSN
jgi:hypothetical protein